MKSRRSELSPCGIFCPACAAFNKSCLGCPSEIKEQKRKSKWSCKIRACCYDEMKIDYCGQCAQFPCKTINKKLISSHRGDTRFAYRHEIPDNMEKLKRLGVDRYIKNKRQEYTCPACGGIVYFYYDSCSQCGARREPPDNAVS